MAKETFYFSHDYNTRTDEKIKLLLRKHGMVGYGVFWSIVEDLYNNANALHLDCEGIAFDLRVDESIVSSVINDFGLFVIDGDSFGSLSVEKRLNERSERSHKARETAYKRWNKSEGNANAMPMHSEGNAIKERKGKKRKGKERKDDVLQISNPENQKPETSAPEKPGTQKKFRPPELSEVENFMFDINYPGIIKNEAEKFVNYYTGNGWMVGKSKMKDWQATVRNWKLRRNEESGTTTGTGAIAGNTAKPSKNGFSDAELFAAVARQHGLDFMPPNGSGSD